MRSLEPEVTIMHRKAVIAITGALLTGAVVLAAPGAAGDEGKEKVVTLDQIPAAARSGLLREAGGAPIQKVEEEQTDKGKTVYEGHVKKGNDVIGIVVDANGKLVGTHSESGEHE
jgi:uncharacterized membrane protein YkoI